ncbi:MAG: hypothetical protein KTR26_06375 [Flammeovirgaceae bacterium]|nr:hypothetical protein [Flammeovirgaceae bacterium]
MKTRRLILPALFIFLSFQTLFAQVSVCMLSQNHWKYESSKVLGQVVQATAAEENDQLVLRFNMTFERVEEGRIYKGTWRYNEGEQKIILNYSGIDMVKYLFVKKANNEELVLKVEEDWKLDTHLRMKAVKAPCSYL